MKAPAAGDVTGLVGLLPKSVSTGKKGEVAQPAFGNILSVVTSNRQPALGRIADEGESGDVSSIPRRLSGRVLGDKLRLPPEDLAAVSNPEGVTPPGHAPHTLRDAMQFGDQPAAIREGLPAAPGLGDRMVARLPALDSDTAGIDAGLVPARGGAAEGANIPQKQPAALKTVPPAASVDERLDLASQRIVNRSELANEQASSGGDRREVSRRAEGTWPTAPTDRAPPMPGEERMAPPHRDPWQTGRESDAGPSAPGSRQRLAESQASADRPGRLAINSALPATQFYSAEARTPVDGEPRLVRVEPSLSSAPRPRSRIMRPPRAKESGRARTSLPQPWRGRSLPWRPSSSPRTG